MSRAPRSDNQPANAASQPILVVDGFLPGRLAMAMRHDIDAHFAKPEAHRRDTHQVWNYWFVPELYSYLRTDAERVIGRDHVDAFHGALRAWSTGHLGMAEASWPYLSLYIPGCRQGWHNDARNGRFAFVYSLTRNERRTTGGETLVMRDGDPFRDHLVSATAGRGLYEAIEPRFNRLVIFDDRLPHAVERVDGLMDPVEGRFVLHGHLSEGSAIIAGALPAAAATEQLNEVLARFGVEMAASVALYHGPLVFRVTVNAAGAVEACEIIVDRVIHPDPGHVGWESVRANLAGRLKALKFPAAKGRTVLIQPVLFGGRIAPG
jgi:2-oxoglutarate-Fe(II)-dependent oxygenase superfamily protein